MRGRLRRLLVPAGAFMLVGVAHVAWAATFPDRDPVQGRWAPVEETPCWVVYRRSGAYWLTYAYGLSGAFAASALLRWWDQRQAAAAGLALGGAAASGAFAAMSCWLLGCCGSPMLSVYLSLLGPAFLPFAKPLVAGVTTLSVVGGAWWLARHARTNEAPCAGPCACGPNASPSLDRVAGAPSLPVRRSG